MGNLDRIATFVSWPADTSVSCLSLANSGFVYTGVSDQVTCPLCGLVVRDWQQRNVDPLNEHRLRSPQCRFFSESSPNQDAKPLSGRVTSHLSSVQQDSSLTEHSASNITAVYRSALERAQRHGVIDNHDRPTGNTATSRDPETSVPAGINRANPNYVLLKHESARLSTFHDWPVSHIVQPSALARAGLFYTGQGDRTGCAFCRGVLHHWQPWDDSDVEHRRHFPDCPFVRQRDVGNVPLPRDATPDRQMAALGISDVSQSTSGDHSSSTASAHAATSSPPADSAANNRPEFMNPRQGLVAGNGEHQTLAENSAEQRTTNETTRITNTLGKCALLILC